jgi:hypothetical protein
MSILIYDENEQQLCSYCGKEKITYKDFCSKLHYFLWRSKSVHGNKYDYSKFEFKTATTRGIIICPIHGEFSKNPHGHYKGSGCQKCGKIDSSNKRTKGLQFYIPKFKDVHKDFYDYSKFIYKGCANKGVIICPKHGDFLQAPVTHVQGHGCPSCKADNTSKRLMMNPKEFIQRASQVHNNFYNYSKSVYKGSDIKLIIICPAHGKFEQRPHDHLKRHGCSKCFTNYSRKSIDWLERVMKREGIFIQHGKNSGEYKIPGTRLSVDGYCKETDTAYEYHGDFWHGNPDVYLPEKIHPRKGITMGEIYKKTLKREEEIRKHVSKLVTIWENDTK